MPVDEALPHPLQIVSIRTRGTTRDGYYRIGDRWYALIDLERWTMNTSPYWEQDRSWYLTTRDVESWLDAGDG